VLTFRGAPGQLIIRRDVAHFGAQTRGDVSKGGNHERNEKG
jgi:hypothetical protein